MTNISRNANDWVSWFWSDFFEGWLARVQDGDAGVFDALDPQGAPDVAAGKSLLAQARTLFTLSHVALVGGDPHFIDAARKQVAFMAKFEKGDGLYRNRARRDGSVTGIATDEAARSYDLGFVILGLVIWQKVSPGKDIDALIEACWGALQTHLTNPDTGLLHNDDTGALSNPAQNPHMHLFEACLQAFRMNGDAVWLSRAADLRRMGLRHFMDTASGSIAEFITPDLKPLPDLDGQRREIGHQCEWAWLLLEEARLGDQPDLKRPAGQLVKFADTYGFAQSGPLKGAVVDAVSADRVVLENSFLLWPQTEAIKILAARHTMGDPDAGGRAHALLCLMFERWFADSAFHVNQLDALGKPIWPETLTRLMYHIVLAVTEGARAGLWPNAPEYQNTDGNQSDTAGT